MMKFYNILKYLFLSCMFIHNSALADVPITTDSRIKTYVYNENEVFLVVVHYGYQSSIEFGLGEEVETLSIGDSYAWKINPLGRRLFIKPLEENIHTNMTVITNRRAYQFDLVSKLPEDNIDKELSYVVKFYYPGEEDNSIINSEYFN